MAETSRCKRSQTDFSNRLLRQKHFWIENVASFDQNFALQKFAKIQRHYSQNIHVHVVLEVNKLNKKIEVTTHLPKKDLHIEVENTDMYAAIDLIADKMDRQIIRYKETHTDSVHSGKSLAWQKIFITLHFILQILDFLKYE